MTLVKKTIILSRKGAKGYLTIVRVGSSTGIKVVIDYEDNELVMGLKIGSNDLIVEKINALKTEMELNDNIDFKNSDDISCIILLNNQIYAEGGTRGRINVQDINQRINKQNADYSNQNKEVGDGKDKGVFQQIESKNSKTDTKDSSNVKTADQRKGIEEDKNTAKNKKIAATNAKQQEKNDTKEVINTSEQNQTEEVKAKEKEKIVNGETKPIEKKAEEAKAQQIEKEESDSIKKQEKKDDYDKDKKDKIEEKVKDTTKNIPKDAKSFYYSVKDKLDELFVMYPREEMLEKIIPSSKWVKINYDREDYYVAGVLLDDNNKVTHIAYGVPGFEGKTPPKETECICDWLPLKNMKKYQGYWLIFQSADTGEILPKD